MTKEKIDLLTTCLSRLQIEAYGRAELRLCDELNALMVEVCDHFGVEQPTPTIKDESVKSLLRYKNELNALQDEFLRVQSLFGFIEGHMKKATKEQVAAYENVLQWLGKTYKKPGA